MNALISYLFEVIVCSALFAGCYWLLMRNRHFHQWNRFCILSLVALSVLIPLMNIPVPVSMTHIMMPEAMDYVPYFASEQIETTVSSNQPSVTPLSWKWIGFTCCLLVALFLLAQEVFHFVRLLRLKHRSDPPKN